MLATRATHGLVALYDPERHMLTLVAARGYAPHALSDAMIQHWLAGQGVVGQAIRDRRTVWIDNVQDVELHGALDPNIQSILAAPILRDGQPLGVVNLASTHLAAFNDELAHFVSQLTTQAAIAIRNAQLYQQARNRLREMSILFDMSRQFTAILALPELGKELTRQMATALGATHCSIELLARDSSRLERFADYAAPGSQPVTLPAQPTGALRQLDVDSIRRSRQPIIIHVDHLSAGDPDGELLRARSVHALIGLPLVAINQITGRIIWLHDQPRAPFTTDEIRFAQTLANQASITVENARLFHERARRINDLSQLYEASLALASSIEIDETLDRIARIAREITDSDAATLYLYDPRTDRITHGSHLASSSSMVDVASIRSDGMTRRVIAHRQPILVDDVFAYPGVNPHVVEAGIRSIIATPILRKDQVMGVLYVNSREPGKYTADSLQLVELLANEAAIAIENTRLFGEIEQARDRLAAILNSARDAILMFNMSGGVVVANPMIEQLWAIPRTSLEGRRLSDLIDDPEIDLAARLGYSPATLRALISQATSGVNLAWNKETFSPPGPHLRTLERIGLPVQDEAGGLVGWMIVLHDVTEEHELQRLREDLSSMIVHDLRSPLVAILDSYELVSEDMPPQDITSVARQALEVGQRSTRKLLNLVNSLLDISRLEHGSLSLDTDFAALRALVENAVEQIAPLSLELSVIVRNQVPPDLPLVKVDEDQITRVLINLIDNAVKFSPIGGQVVISARANGGSDDGIPRFITVSVRDNGPGIPPEHHKRVFDRFVQVNESVQRRRGTGLGLAFCKFAVEAHGGTIWVESPPDGKGSLFRFTLPTAILPALER
jgi:PAS domain S-box-containing protein